MLYLILLRNLYILPKPTDSNDPTYPGLAVTRITSVNIFDPGHVQAVAAANAHKTNPLGHTSVGDGVDLVRQVLNALPAVVTLGMNEFEPGRFEVTTQATITARHYI